MRPAITTSVKETIKRFMTRRAEGVITYTAGGTDYWRKQGLPEDRVIPYYNTIDVEGLRKEGKTSPNSSDGAEPQAWGWKESAYCCSQGRLYAEKQVDFLLRAFAILKKIYPDVALLIIGDGEERINLERQLNNLNFEMCTSWGNLWIPKRPRHTFLWRT